MRDIRLFDYYNIIINHLRDCCFRAGSVSGLNIKCPILISNIKRLHDNDIRVDKVLTYLSQTQYKVSVFDSQVLIERFIVWIPAIKISGTESNAKKEVIKKSDSDDLNLSNIHPHAEQVFQYYARKVDCVNTTMKPVTKDLMVISERLISCDLPKIKLAIDNAATDPYYLEKGVPLRLLFSSCAVVHELASRKATTRLTSSERRSESLKMALHDAGSLGDKIRAISGDRRERNDDVLNHKGIQDEIGELPIDLSYYEVTQQQ